MLIVYVAAASIPTGAYYSYGYPVRDNTQKRNWRVNVNVVFSDFVFYFFPLAVSYFQLLGFGLNRFVVVFSLTGRLLPRAAVEEEIADNEYLGAAMRLTSELARYAITQVRNRRSSRGRRG